MRFGSFFFVLALSMIALGYLLSESIFLRKDLSEAQQNILPLSPSAQELGQVNEEILKLRQDLDALSGRIDSADASPDVLLLSNEINKINQRLTVIEGLITLSPENAMTVTLIKVELEHQKQEILRLNTLIAELGVAIFGSFIVISLNGLLAAWRQNRGGNPEG